MKKFLIVVLYLVPYCLFSSETSTVTPIQYDAERTKQLQAIVDGLNDETYPQQRGVIKSLVEARANPNVRQGGWAALSLLRRAVSMDDIELTTCCVDHGAQVNFSENEGNPARYAKSVAMLDILVGKYPNLLHHKNAAKESLLHNAATNNRGPSMVAYLCNAGLDPNEQDIRGSTPLHNCFLMSQSHGNQDTLQTAAVLSWYGAGYCDKNNNGETQLEIVQRISPQFTPQVEALQPAVLHVKAQHKEEYNNTVSKKLKKRIVDGPTGIVISYVEPPWEPRCWPEINAHMTEQAPASKK